MSLSRALAGLEEAAGWEGVAHERDVTPEMRINLSIAISLKRIADAITGEGQSILTSPINSYGESIGEAIQGQMIRGQRGIDQYEGR